VIAPPEEFERLVTKYLGLLGIGHPWKVEVVVRTDPEESLVDPDDPDAYAACSCLPEYYRATLHFDALHESWQSVEAGDIERCVRHEVLHIPLGILSCLARDMLGGNTAAREAIRQAEERVATLLEFAPLWDQGG